MIVIWILVLAAVLAVAFFGLGFLPPPHASTVIKIAGEAVEVRRGHVQGQAREHVTEILREAGVTRGFIALTSQSRVVFSRSVPETIRQRLRNVLVNQWM